VVAIAGTVLTVLSPSCDGAGRIPERIEVIESDVLARPVSSEGLVGLPIEIVTWLHGEHRLPISFIEADRDRRVDLGSQPMTTEKVLEKVVSANPAYRWGVVQDRLMLYPRDKKYDALVAGIDIRDLKRPDAANRLFEVLRRGVPGFGDYSGAFLLGVADAPEYTQRVSLRPEARVIEHLEQLLGDDRQVYFMIYKSRTVRVISFRRIESG
jgi:hypothetical protein